MEQKCIIEVLDHLEKVSLQRTSNSILLFATHPDYGLVTVKLSLDSEPQNNSLEVERQIYMYLNELDPMDSRHFLKAITIGTCHSESHIFHNIKGLDQSWHQLRGKMLLRYHREELPQRLWEELEKQEDLSTNGLTDAETHILISKLLIRDPLYQLIHFVMMPRLRGLSLFEWLGHNTTHLTTEKITMILIQVAQALCLGRNIRLAHNDLHLDNIFIEIFPEEKTFGYQTPFPFSLYTKIKIIIFDFNDSSLRNETIHLTNTKLNFGPCHGFGQCNMYRLSADWVYFLHEFFYRLEEVGFLQAHAIRQWFFPGSKPFQHQPEFGNLGQNARRGRSCKCEELMFKDRAPSEANPCIRCKPYREAASADFFVMLPNEFLNSTYASPHLQLPPTTLKIHTSQTKKTYSPY